MTPFWKFWLEPADVRPLRFLRVGVATVGLVQLVMLWPSLVTLYGNYGVVQWAISDAGNDAWLPTLGALALFAKRHGFDWPTDQIVSTVFALFGTALVGLLTGIRPRLFASVALLTHLMTTNSGYFSTYGVDTLLHVSLFYLTWAPSSGAPSETARLGLRALQLHLCMVYLDAGFAKFVGPDWWSGESLWRTLMQPNFGQFDARFFADMPWLPMIGGWVTVITECGYPFAMWHPKLRRPWLAAVVALHLGIGLFMGLWLFSAVMIVMNIAAVGIGEKAGAKSWLRFAGRVQPAP